jgi:osmotically-inducible protein OsmY
MDYARFEMQFVRGGWLHGTWVQGAVEGQVCGAAVDPSNLTVTHTLLGRKLAQQLAADGAAATETANGTALEGAILLRGHAQVRARGGLLGSVSRLWVSKGTGRVTQVLVRARARLERIVPAELIESVGGTGIVVRVSPSAVAELPIYRADALIAAEVQQALDETLTNPRARRDVKVHVDDGHVTLAGEVDTIEQVHQAGRAAAMVAGIRGMTVDLAAQEALAAAVEARIAALAAAASNGHGPVRVLAEHGIVYLEGGVTSTQASREIESIALAAAGARVVVNNLYINGELPGQGLGTGPLVRNR